MSGDVSTKNYDFRTTPEIIFESLYDSEKARQWFPTIKIVHKSDQLKIEELKKEGIEYIARINYAKPYSSIKGIIESLDGEEKQVFEWVITQNKEVKNWCRLTTIKISEQKRKNWISPLPAVGAAGGLAAILASGFGSLSSAYGASAISTASVVAPIASQSASTQTTTSGIVISKKVMTAIAVSTVIAASGGIIAADAYFSNPYVEYTIHPAQLPAELYGTTIIVTNVYATDDKNEIIDYSCNTEPIVYGLKYNFDCTTKNALGNTQKINTEITIKEPNDWLGEQAKSCLSNHISTTDEMTKKYTYLTKLPNASHSKVDNLKTDHITMMDDYYESYKYAEAKKHATIVLKYFDNNDVQALSTMGNIIRDENRENISNTECAIAIHNTPFILNTVWGKISLAEDYHVFGDYQKSIHWSSIVIDDYNNNSDVHETSYVNALIIKANALYRQSLYDDKGFEEAKENYLKAHNIEASYDTWFGLGNIDRHEEKFEEAWEKYQQAKKLAENSSEIDEAIRSMPQILGKT